MTPNEKEILKDEILRVLTGYYANNNEEGNTKSVLSQIVNSNDKELYIFAIRQYITRKRQLPEPLSEKIKVNDKNEDLIKDIVIYYINNNVVLEEYFLAEIKRNNNDLKKYYDILIKIRNIYESKDKEIPDTLTKEIEINEINEALDFGGKKIKKQKTRRRKSNARKSKRRAYRKK